VPHTTIHARSAQRKNINTNLSFKFIETRPPLETLPSAVADKLHRDGINEKELCEKVFECA